MKLKMKILVLMGSLLLLVFAVNVGLASAAGPGNYVGGNEADGINTAALAGAYAPVGSNLITGGADQPGAQGAVNGFNWDFETSTADPTNPAVSAIARNPLCPRHVGNGGPGP